MLSEKCPFILRIGGTNFPNDTIVFNGYQRVAPAVLAARIRVVMTSAGTPIASIRTRSPGCNEQE